MFTKEECLRQLLCSCYRTQSKATGTVFELKVLEGNATVQYEAQCVTPRGIYIKCAEIKQLLIGVEEG